MKKFTLLFIAGVLFFSVTGTAQIFNKDSLKLVESIQKDQVKLAKMQNSLADKTKEKEQAAQKAQESADDNRKAANKLGEDPQDKKLARRADNEASDARRDAKRARIAADRVESQNKDIRNLTEKIAKEQTKLNKYVAEYQANIQAAPAAVKDSIKN